MFPPQVSKDVGSGPGFAGLYIVISATYTLRSLCEILAFPFKIIGEGLIECRFRILPTTFGVLFQLRPAL